MRVFLNASSIKALIVLLVILSRYLNFKLIDYISVQLLMRCESAESVTIK